MRPHVMTKDKGLQENRACHLYAHRDTMNSKAWVLSWSVPGSNITVGAEGECSRKYHRTMRSAIMYGQRIYGETAKLGTW